ncbi:hypothetical protein [Haloarcula argentinensis]|uniref:Uncharacterized protein n=1 Tax=Haloarcula argentinensis TaxID=43776 RepID=A0A830FMQ6_HALAR|nr:hypothetical protein [Haloarcula argentinensis]GGM52555.1 hypothetical protein GCM10009006_37140 [Haloarcula argentinensis]
MYEPIQKAATPMTMALLVISLAVVELALRPYAGGSLQLAVSALSLVIAVALLTLGAVSLRK